MADENSEEKQDPKDIQEFLQRLSRDKHAFGAHMGMRVDRDFTRLEEHERNKTAAKEKEQAKPKRP
jgi:hypothetical protein